MSTPFTTILWYSTTFLDTDGCHVRSWSPSSLQAERPCASQLCSQWPIHGRDSGVFLFCVWGVSASDLADYRLEKVQWQVWDLEASGFVLVCLVWLHSLCHWGLVLTVLWCHSWRPEFLITALWVHAHKMKYQMWQNQSLHKVQTDDIIFKYVVSFDREGVL